MSGWLWAYSPSKCDNDYCPYNCDKCRKAEILTFRDEVEILLDNEWFKGDMRQKDKILDICDDARFSIDDVTMAIYICSDAKYEDVYSAVEAIVYECFG